MTDIYVLTIKIYRNLDFEGFPNKHGLLLQMLWAAKKTQ